MQIPKNFGLKISGIYKITNIINNKFYIGSSVNIYYRLKRHYSDLKRGIHQNKYLLNSYIKYGEESFIVSIIEEISNDLLLEREQYWINILKPNYNIVLDVVRSIPSIESNRKASETLKRKYADGTLIINTTNTKMHPVNLYNSECKCIGKYVSERDAARALVLLYPDIKYPQSIVNLWSRKSNKIKSGRYKKHYILKPDELCLKVKEGSHLATRILCENIETGEKIIYNNIIACALALKCTRKVIQLRLKKPELMYKNFKICKDG